MAGFPQVRLRRLRALSGLRQMLSEPVPGPEKLVWPVFVVEGKGKEIPIEAMPGQFRYSADRLCAAVEPVAAAGIGGVLIFGVVDDSRKSARGEHCFSKNGVVQKSVAALAREFPELVVFTDVCLCAYTSHGHCGPLDRKGTVDNDAAVEILGKMAVSHAEAGASCVAPSAMMDGQVGGIRKTLDANDFKNIPIMSYSTKFSSSMYGPFREAAGSAPSHGDRRGYQTDYANPLLALRESVLDEEEGADLLMVKPSMFYLDVIARLRARTLLPIAAYNVSGEYSMIVASAQNGWGELEAMARESLVAIRRAGADLILTYWANQYRTIFPK